MNLLRNLIFVFSLIVIPNSLKANNKVNYEAEIFLRSNLTTICDAYKKNLISYETNKKLKDLGLEMHATYYPGLEYEKNQSVSKIYSEAKESYRECWEDNFIVSGICKGESYKDIVKCMDELGGEGLTRFDPRQIELSNVGMGRFFFLQFYKDFKSYGNSGPGPWGQYALISNLVTTCNAYKTNLISDFQKLQFVAIGIKTHNDLTPGSKEINTQRAKEVIKMFESKNPKCLTGF